MRQLVLDHREIMGEESTQSFIRLIDSEQKRYTEIREGLIELDRELFRTSSLPGGRELLLFFRRTSEGQEYQPPSTASQAVAEATATVRKKLDDASPSSTSWHSIPLTPPAPFSASMALSSPLQLSKVSELSASPIIPRPLHLCTQSISLNPEPSTSLARSETDIAELPASPFSTYSLTPPSSPSLSPESSTPTPSETSWPISISPTRLAAESGIWIMNKTWLSNSSVLSEPESLFLQGKYQGGLIMIACTLRSLRGAPSNTPLPTFSPNIPSRGSSRHTTNTTASGGCGTNQIINAHLLKSCALLACSQATRGLESANTAIDIASRNHIYHLVSKSQLYRGLCLKEMEHWKEASKAFTRAANVRGWAGRVGELKTECERKFIEETQSKKRNKGKQKL